MAIERMELHPKYGDMFNFLSFHRNLPAPLSFRMQGKFSATLSFINERASEIEICLHHFHLWCSTNLPATLSFINERPCDTEICWHHYHLSPFKYKLTRNY